MGSPNDSQQAQNTAAFTSPQDAPSENRASAPRSAIRSIALIAAFIAPSWIPFLLDVLLVQPDPAAPRDPFERTRWLLFALATTIIVPPVALWTRRRRLRLLETALRVPGKPFEISETGHGGMRSVTFGYLVHGVSYTLRQHVSDSVCRHYDEQTTVEVAFDPRNPAHAIVVDVNPGRLATSAKLSRTLGATVAAPFAAMGISALVVFVVWTSFRRRELNEMTAAGLVFYAAALALVLDWTIRRLLGGNNPLVKQTYFRWALVAICLGAAVVLTNV